jgi:hypothetical protein
VLHPVSVVVADNVKFPGAPEHPVGHRAWPSSSEKVQFRLYKAINATKCGCGYKDRTMMAASLSISWSRSLGKPVDGLRR